VGRPSLGKGARTRTGTLKISGFEEDLLRERFGTVNKGMRYALDYYLAKEQMRTNLIAADAKPDDLRQLLGEEPAAPEVDLPATVIPCRIHRAYVETGRWMDKGVEFVEKTCADCGHVTSGQAR
jgi:hypothetical protein